MNIHALNQGLSIAGKALDELEAARQKLSSGSKKTEIGRLINDARERLKEAEARIAHELEFPICKRCWPPEIMVHDQEGRYVCRKCGKEMISEAEEITDLDDLSTW